MALCIKRFVCLYFNDIIVNLKELCGVKISFYKLLFYELIKIFFNYFIFRCKFMLRKYFFRRGIRL